MTCESEIKRAVAAQIEDIGLDVEALTYAEVYGFDDGDVKRAMYWQERAVVTVTFREGE